MNIDQIPNIDVLFHLFSNQTINLVKKLSTSDDTKVINLESGDMVLRLIRINNNMINLQIKLLSEPYFDKDSRYIPGQGYTAKRISFYKLVGSYENINNQIQLRIPFYFKSSAELIIANGYSETKLPIVDFTIHENALIGAYSVEAFDYFNEVKITKDVILNSIHMVIVKDEKISKCHPTNNMLMTLSYFDWENRSINTSPDVKSDVDSMNSKGLLDTCNMRFV